MKAEEDQSFVERVHKAALEIIKQGKRCSTVDVAVEAGLPRGETSKVFRALDIKDGPFTPDWDTPGMYTVFKLRKP